VRGAGWSTFDIEGMVPVRPRTPRKFQGPTLDLPVYSAAVFPKRGLAACLTIVLVAGCGSTPATTGPASPGATGGPGTANPTVPDSTAGATPGATSGATLEPTPTSALPTGAPATGGDGSGGVYAGTIGGQIKAAWADIPARVYVPNEKSADVVVIDPATFKILDRLKVSAYPEHITPAWDGQLLYVNDMIGHALTVIDPRTSKATGTIKLPSPYNLYFTPDGTRAIDVEDMNHGYPTDQNGLLFLDPKTWKKIGFVGIPWAGANHLDFSADGKTLFITTEFTGRIVAVDVDAMKIIKSFDVGGSPTDVRLAPDGSVVFVANQVRDVIDIVNTTTLEYDGFIKAGPGAHGIALSRDVTKLYVTNREAGTLSVVDIASRTVVDTWTIGGTPDMIAQSPDGSQLWISNRYSGTISVVDASTGAVIKVIATGANPHGLTYWPQPGQYSLGHNGNMR
jgi:YVTN family beta-propeller protein